MKKTFSVNLGNRVFSIDDDAYIRLKEYLDRIESYFSDEKEREDIISDIELRISELFTERMGLNKQVITLRDVEEVIAIMGDPKEISGTEGQAGGNQSHDSHQRRTGPRRIYRDPDDRMIGGVCGGLAAYLGLDPVIVRILFILFLIFGIGLLVYIILWIVVPEARTTAQKLEMRGDTVNVSNIGNFVKEEFDNVKKSFSRKKK
ncbi:MAG TPA: PspC domain-containing protein [Bacteroidales bacterium]|nr:PspC domain-containing protein [Bacteroidales bacterium]